MFGHVRAVAKQRCNQASFRPRYVSFLFFLSILRLHSCRAVSFPRYYPRETVASLRSEFAHALLCPRPQRANESSSARSARVTVLRQRRPPPDERECNQPLQDDLRTDAAQMAPTCEGCHRTSDPSTSTADGLPEVATARSTMGEHQTRHRQSRNRNRLTKRSMPNWSRHGVTSANLTSTSRPANASCSTSPTRGAAVKACACRVSGCTATT